jgi:hypothetical protein
MDLHDNTGVIEVVDSLCNPSNRLVVKGSNCGVELDIKCCLASLDLLESLFNYVPMS